MHVEGGRGSLDNREARAGSPLPLFCNAAPFVLHLAAVEAHAWIVAEARGELTAGMHWVAGR
jgi:hypothetical protein